jgi:hypothetical protein
MFTSALRSNVRGATRHDTVALGTARHGAARRKHRFVYCCVIAGTCLEVTVLAWSKHATISKAAKLQVYKTLIRPAATYGAKTWTLTVIEENILRKFERKIIRKIYGPVMENNIWRTRHTYERNTLLKEEDILRFIKSQEI